MEIIIQIAKALIEENCKYMMQCEINSTEAEKQIAIIKEKTKELQANAEMAREYFQHQIRERESLFQSANALLEKAIETGNVELAQLAMRTIEIVHNQSPFSF